MNIKLKARLKELLFVAAIILIASALIGLSISVLLFQNTELSEAAGFWVGSFCAVVSVIHFLKKFVNPRLSIKPLIRTIAEERQRRINREATRRRYADFKERQRRAERKPYYETNW